MMLRSHPRPPPIDVIAAKSVVISAAPSFSPCLTPGTDMGLIQILPPQAHMEQLQAVRHILYNHSPLSPAESESIPTSSPSNRHSVPLRSLPSSPASIISPVSPASSDLTHITFSEVELEYTDESTITFVPSGAWTSCKRPPKGDAVPDSPHLPFRRRRERAPLSIIASSWLEPPAPSLPCSPLRSPSSPAPMVSPPPPSPASTLPRSPISPLELPSPQYKPRFPRHTRRREMSTFDLPQQAQLSSTWIAAPLPQRPWTGTTFLVEHF